GETSCLECHASFHIDDRIECVFADPTLSRAEALNRTMLDLIDKLSYMNAEGKIVFSYAHPVFWAPFSLVGDGG
ncbi:MAG: hypothetical protein JRI73_10330, partial [Deltaproteobacteria bacterium]|nr:hypothetical protein [Deltaproteobacteria bacterium]